MKRLPQNDADAGDDGDDEGPAKRTRFVELQPAVNDPADGIDDEIPGSMRADVEPLVLGDRPFDPYEAGDPHLSASRAAADPGFARAQRSHLRQQRQDQGALRQALQAQEKYDQPEEDHNEVGDPIEPFHLRRELEEGAFDAAGNYIEYEREDERDAWLDSIDDQVQGVGPDRGSKLPPPNEPVAEPPPLRRREQLAYWRRCLEVLQPGESVPAALRRLAGAGPVLAKFGSKAEARQFFQDRIRSGHAVPPGNNAEFQALTEAAEVLLDAGCTNVYSLTREQAAARLRQEQAAERAPPAAAPSPAAAAEAAAQFGGAGGSEEAGEGAQAGPVGGGGHLRRHRSPPAAAPPAAAEPAVAADRPSVPSAERTGASTRGGAGVGAAAHGFAAQVPADLLGEMPLSGLPPPEVEAGLGLPASAPTAEHLKAQQMELRGEVGPSLEERVAERQAGAMSAQQGITPMQAALFGSFADRAPPPPQQRAAAAAAACAGGAAPAGLPAQQAQQVKAVAFDNEAANLAAALPGAAAGGGGAAEE